MANRVPITVRLESFEGPLDLLLYLIQTHALDISRVSIGRITDQYLAYVLQMQELNFDIASEFLVMAATLLHWKSRALLPQEEKPGENSGLEDGPLSEEALVRQLLEHQRFLEAGENLAQLPLLGTDVFSRANAKPAIERVWKQMNITDLTMSYQEILIRSRKRTQVLRKETVSIADKIGDFASRLVLRQLLELRKLLSADPSRAEIVATFLAALELSRLKKMRLHQEEVYREIYLELLERIRDSDIQLATGFDSVNTPAPGASPALAEAPPA